MCIVFQFKIEIEKIEIPAVMKSQKKDNKIAIRTVGKNDPENIIRVFFRALIKLKIPIKSQAEIGNMRTQLLSRDFWKSL